MHSRYCTIRSYHCPIQTADRVNSPQKPLVESDELSGVQVVVSSMIVLHIVFLVACVFSGSAESQLVSRLAGAAIPHSILGLHTDFPPAYRLSHSMDFEDDHHFEVIVDGKVTHRFPSAATAETGIREGYRYQRFRQMARRAARAVINEDDVTLSELSRGIGEFVSERSDTDRMVVQLVAFRPYDWRTEAPQPLSSSLDPAYYDSLYSADVWRAKSGAISVHKRVPAAEAAPPVGANR